MKCMLSNVSCILPHVHGRLLEGQLHALKKFPGCGQQSNNLASVGRFFMQANCWSIENTVADTVHGVATGIFLLFAMVFAHGSLASAIQL